MNSKTITNLGSTCFLLILIVVVILNGACGSSKVLPQKEILLEEINWLIGYWERADIKKKGQRGVEIWRKEKDKLIGLGILIQGRDTLFKERFQIIIKGNQLHYIANVGHDAAPVSFLVTSKDQQHFVCENQQHDFPKRIGYYLESEGELRANVAADEKSQDFVFRKRSN